MRITKENWGMRIGDIFYCSNKSKLYPGAIFKLIECNKYNGLVLLVLKGSKINNPPLVVGNNHSTSISWVKAYCFNENGLKLQKLKRVGL